VWAFKGNIVPKAHPISRLLVLQEETPVLGAFVSLGLCDELSRHFGHFYSLVAPRRELSTLTDSALNDRGRPTEGREPLRKPAWRARLNIMRLSATQKEKKEKKTTRSEQDQKKMMVTVGG